MLGFCAWLTQVAGVSRREFFDVTDQLREIFKWEESWQSWLESEETFVIRDLGPWHGPQCCIRQQGQGNPKTSALGDAKSGSGVK
jgi:hypothetical protein